MAATIAIITGLCGLRRKHSPHLDTDPPSDAAETTSVPPQQATTSTALETDDAQLIKELPPPPAMRTLTETYSCNNAMTKSTSTRKFSTTLSAKHSRSISVSKIREKKKIKAEDSLWRKTIILGEKCKRLDDEDDDEGELNTVSASHSGTQSTMSISRTNSFIDPDTVPNQDKEKGITRKEEEEDS
ncbi:hypothetical protein DITRI_Ditri10aG0106800 [Diplodiscus trichospermus]